MGSGLRRDHEGISMAYDPRVSPVGWYIASYLLRFVELGDAGNDDLERRFLIWENTILVKASSIDEAYDRAVAIGRDATKPYKGGPSPGVDVQWLFEGVSELLPIFDEIGDGCEVMWSKFSRKLKNIRARAHTKAELNRLPRGFKGPGGSRDPLLPLLKDLKDGSLPAQGPEVDYSAAARGASTNCER